ncbi:MAG: hypothetical protein LBJ16_02655 [Holosporaceae bacterium]|nr:hypothetical protein [Holosporaceae bacterium]
MTSENSSEVSEKKCYGEVFQKLIDEMVDAISKDDLPHSSNKIWKIYEDELFDDVGFCGIKPLYALLEINSTLNHVLKGAIRYRVKKSEYENALKDYNQMKERLISDLKTLSDSSIFIKNDFRYTAVTLLERVYGLHLCNFIGKNRPFLTDVWYDYVSKVVKDSDRVPAGLNEAIPDHDLSLEYANFPNSESVVFVFSIKNSCCKVVAFANGCCDAAIYRMYLLDPRKGQKLEEIHIDVRHPFGGDKNVNDIHIGHSHLNWDKENFTFSVGEEEYKRIYTLDLKNKCVRSAAKK